MLILSIFPLLDFGTVYALKVYKAEININYLLAGIKVGLIVLGVIVFNQLLSGVQRPSGVMNADVFAILAVLMFFVVLVFSQQEVFKHKIFTLLSLLSGFFVIAVSGTRGAWVSLFLLLGIYLYFLYKQKTQTSKISIIIVVLMIATALSVGILNQNVNDRVHLAYTQTSNWFLGDKTPNSVGNRLEMYKRAIDNAENVPFFGHGYRTSNIVLFKNASTSIEKYTRSYNHLHNAYLTNLYNGGIALLGALLLLLFVPLRIFIKAMSQNRDKPVFIAISFRHQL